VGLEVFRDEEPTRAKKRGTELGVPGSASSGFEKEGKLIVLRGALRGV